MEEIEVLNEGLYYTTVDGFSLWISKGQAGILTSDVPNSVEINNDKIKDALFAAETLVDSYLNTGNYIVPVPAESKRSIYLLRIICYSIAAYELYSSKGVNTEQYYKHKATLLQLEKIALGSILLVDAIQSTDLLVSGALLPPDYIQDEVGEYGRRMNI